MYNGAAGGGMAGDGGYMTGGPRYSIDAQQMYGAYRPNSRAATPRSDRGNAFDSMYPTYDPSQPPLMSPDAESVYEERDLGQLYNGGAAYNAPYAGPSSSKPPRSSYGSPSPNRQPRTSLEVGQLYNRPYAPSSAPPDYPPYGAEQYNHVPGAFPGPHSEPAADEYYWYAGAPPSIASSGTMYGGMADRPISSRASAPAGTYDGQGYAEQAGFFGVRAPHHHPGHRFSQGPPTRMGEHLPNFPQWSRTWYDGHLSANGHAYTNVPPPSGESGWESDTLTRSGGGPGGVAFAPYGHVYGKGRGGPDFVKEERIRMLEKQFGKPKVSHKGVAEDEDEEEEEERDDDEIDDADLPYGSVNSRGKLVVERPRLRLALRWLIGLGVIACVATGIGGALLVKPGERAPASRGSIAAYILYACSAITLVIIAYLFVFRPCCCDPMRKELKGAGPGGAYGDNPLAGMIIPVLSGANAGGKPMKQKKFGRGRKGAMMMQQQAPTVNLIVDPALLGRAGGGRRGRKGDDYDDDDEDDERLPGDARRSSRRKNGLGVLGNMQMQRRWMVARKSLKVFTVWDSILCVAWIACSIVALGLGKSCPVGDGNGWCNYYNGAIACGVILAVLFAVAIYFDYRDLQVSKKPPKPPM